MHISKLLEAPFNTTVRDVQSKKELANYSKKPKNLSHGTFSAVKDDPQDPHMVRKFSINGRHPYDSEGFKAFITYILQNGYQENIHMPRVYDMKTIRGSDGYELDSYRVEKLIPMNSVSREELVAYTEMVMDNPEIKDDYSISLISSILAEEVNIAVEEFQPYFKLDSLNEACHIVAMALQATNGTNDINNNNLMFRRTGSGLQLVFSDPIYLE